MVQAKRKVGKSELGLLKDFCSRSSDESLNVLADLLPQTIGFDRSKACSILQEDQQVDRWLAQATDSEDWFNRVDSVGPAAVAELESRRTKK